MLLASADHSLAARRTHCDPMARILQSTVSIQRLFCTSTTKVINIPQRIERGPTDILKALASVVGRDPTASSYCFIDDPALEPLGVFQKRSYAISREQGRRAAKYFLQNYPQLFYRNDAEPKIAAYEPPDQVSAETKCIEEDIIAAIQGTQVINAIECYKNCIENKVPVSPETEQMLLEMCCFSNSRDIEYEWLQEKWYEATPYRRRVDIWSEDSFAETLYHKIGENEASVNCMICGYCKHGSNERAHALYQRAREINVNLHLQTFNSLISSVTFLTSSGQGRKEMMLHFLSEMKKNCIKPDAETFVNILDNLVSTQVWRECRSFALQVFNEMVHLKITPPLAAFHHLIAIFTDQRSGEPEPEIIYSVMQLLQAQVKSLQDDPQSDGKLKLIHPRDGSFFTLAMSKINQMLSDLELANDLHDIVVCNPHCFDSSVSESRYYKEMFTLLTKVATVDKLLETYENFVPHTYVPDSDLYTKIIDSIAVEGREDLIPRFISDLALYIRPKEMPDFSKYLKEPETKTEENQQDLDKV